MIGFRHCRVVFVCLLGCLFLLGCTGRQQFWISPTMHELDEMRGRTVPSNGSLLRASEAVRNDSSVRATWEIQTGSDSQAYFQWLKNQLGPQYHVTSETASAIKFVKAIVGDSYTVAIRSSGAAGGRVLESQFVAAPD